MNEKRRLLGMTLDELKGVAFEAGLPGYAATVSYTHLTLPTN